MEKRQKTTTTVTTSTTAESGGAARTAVTATQSGMSIGFGAGRWEFTAASLEAREHAELPTDRLVQAPLDGLEPVVVVSCGSFSPPTLMHLRILEDAKDHLQSTGKYAVVGGYISPCHAAYGKASLVDMHHRLNMCQVRDVLGGEAPLLCSLSLCVTASCLLAPSRSVSLLVLCRLRWRTRAGSWLTHGSAASRNGRAQPWCSVS